MTQRLTMEISATILRKAIKHRFDKEDEALKRRSFGIAQKIYDLTYDAATQKLMNAMPQGFMPHTDKARYKLVDKGYINELVLAHFLPCAQKYKYGEAITLPAGLSKKLAKLHTDKAATLTQIATAKGEMTSALAAFKTIKALLAAWPEIKPFIPEGALEDKARLMPVPQVKLINKTFKLPVKTVAKGKIEDNYEVAA